MRDVADIERELAEKRAELGKLRSEPRTAPLDVAIGARVIAFVLGIMLGFVCVTAYRAMQPPTYEAYLHADCH